MFKPAFFKSSQVSSQVKGKNLFQVKSRSSQVRPEFWSSHQVKSSSEAAWTPLGWRLPQCAGVPPEHGAGPGLPGTPPRLGPGPEQGDLRHLHQAQATRPRQHHLHSALDNLPTKNHFWQKIKRKVLEITFERKKIQFFRRCQNDGCEVSQLFYSVSKQPQNFIWKKTQFLLYSNGTLPL